MIAAGAFPFAGERAPSSETPRVGDGVIVLDADAGSQYTSPNAVSALHRMGIHANADGPAARRARLRRRRRPRPPSNAREPVTEEIERGRRSRCSSALHPAARAAAQVVGARAAAARRLRAAPPRPAAAVEGRHDPRDPPPGEEQPADDLVAAAAAGPAAGVARGEGGDRGVGAAHPLDRARARDPVARGGRGRAVRRDRAAARAHGRGERWCRPIGRCDFRSTATPASCRRRSRRRWRSCSPSCCRTRSTTPFRDGRPRAATSCSSCDDDGDRAACAGDRRRRRACPRASPSTRPPGLGLSIVRALVTSDSGGHDRHARPRRRAGPGTVVELRVPGPREVRDQRGEASSWRSCWWRSTPDWRRSHALRSLRRSSDVPPQMPESWLVARANSRHALCAALAGTRPWRSRSARSPGRWCRPGRTGRDRVTASGYVRHSSDRVEKEQSWLASDTEHL